MVSALYVRTHGAISVRRGFAASVCEPSRAQTDCLTQKQPSLPALLAPDVSLTGVQEVQEVRVKKAFNNYI